MVRRVVEVVVRFGDTLLDVRHLGASDTYRIGTAPDVDLPVVGHTSYPLVDRGTVRVPVGIAVHASGATTAFELGGATFEITRTKLRRTPLPLRRPEWRTPIYLAASLLAHLAIWLAAITLEPFEQLVVKQQPRMRFVHIGEPPPLPPDSPPPAVTPPPQKQPAHATAAAGQPARAHDAAAAGQPARAHEERAPRPMLVALEETIAHLKLADKLDEPIGEGELYDEDAMYDKGFGGSGRHLDVGGTVPSGDYVTINFDVKLCPDKSCTIRGPFPPQGVRSYLHSVLPAIHECFERYADGPGTIVLEFTITRRYDGDGEVRNAKGKGLGETGPCAATVVAGLTFKAFEQDTRVRYPIRFN